MKKVVITILLVLLLLFHLFAVAENVNAKVNKVIEEKEVTIIDSYTVQTGDSGESSYMTGTDGDRYYKIVGSGYEMGDVIRIYRNANSVNAQAEGTAMGDPEWYTSVGKAEQTEGAAIVLFSILAMINAVVLAVYLKKSMVK